MKKTAGYFLIIAFLFLLSLVFYSIDEIFIERTLAQVVRLEIDRGEDADSIIERLKEAGLIRNKSIAKAYIVMTGVHKEIKPGLYSLGPTYSVKEVFDRLTSGGGIAVKIYEGQTIREIAQTLLETGIIGNAIEFERMASRFDNSFGRYKFLPKQRDVNLEGYLFPDTYKFWKSTVTEVVEEMLDDFNNKAYSQFSNLNPEEFSQIIIMASMLEKEVRTERDMKLVSGVLWKRLEADIPLQVDATLVYVKCDVMKLSDCRVLSNGDKQLVSPYNTYLNLGLPPGPIANPGLIAIEAVLRPQTSSYWYYLSARDDGRTIFAETLDEHNANRLIYR